MDPSPRLRRPNRLKPGPGVGSAVNRATRSRRFKTTREALTRENQQQKAELDKLRQDRAQLQKDVETARAAQKTAEEMQAILEDRADSTEEALAKAKKSGAADKETIKRLQAQSDSAKKALRDSQIENEAAQDVRKQTSPPPGEHRDAFATVGKGAR